MCISSPQSRKHPMRWTKYVLSVDELSHSCSRNVPLNVLFQQVASAALRGEVLNWESQKPVPVPSSLSSADYTGKLTDTKSSPAFCIFLTIICNFHLWYWLPKHSRYFLACYLLTILNPSNLNLSQTTLCVYTRTYACI